MDLSPSDEQRLLGDSVRGLLSAQGPTPDPRGLWSAMADLGWLGLPLPEAQGGLGQGAVDVGLIAEGFGRHLLGQDYVPAIVLCGGLVSALGDGTQRDAILPALGEGRLRLALAHAEPEARWRLPHVATRAARDGEGWRLDGRKIAVLGGGEADHLIVTARLSGSTRDTAGIGLFLLRPDAPGLRIEGHATPDGGTAARIALDGVTLPRDALLGGDGDPFPHLEAAWDRAVAAWCAELVGIIDALTEATIDYAKTRVQFGKPLAVNQVLRHRLADMSIAAEEARSMALRAALSVDGEDAQARALAVAGAWAKIGRAALSVAEGAVQMHGGMGVTDELRIGAYLKRVVALHAIVGPPHHHLRRHAALSGRAPAAA